MSKLSVVLLVRNEEENIGKCLEGVKDLADEIVVADDESIDKTVEIAQSFGAKIIRVKHEPLFHINKEKVLEAAQYEWVLQLDADEIVTPSLREEIKKIVNMNDKEIEKYQENLPKRKLFLRHQKILEKRDGAIGTKGGSYTGFFIPRLNYFLGSYLKWGGAYPDGVIRLVKKGKAYFPTRNVHELIAVEGKVGWLKNDLIHMSDPTFGRYLKRNSRYIDLLKDELKEKKLPKNIISFLDYCLLKPISWFLGTQIRHKGILDGIPGIIFSFFSALRFPRAYLRYLNA